MENIDDINLLKRLCEGDKEAIEAVFRDYSNGLFSFIMRMVDDHNSAEDIFQETWLRVIKYSYTFHRRSKFSTWLFQIAINVIRDQKNHEKKMKYLPIDDFEEVLHHKSSFDNSESEKSEIVKIIIDSLPVKQKEVVILRYYHDLSENEVSEILVCPKGTVKSRLFNASVTIREKWARYLEIERYKNNENIK